VRCHRGSRRLGRGTAIASPIDDPGDGACYAESFEPAEKIERLLGDGFMQGFFPGVAAALSRRQG